MEKISVADARTVKASGGEQADRQPVGFWGGLLYGVVVAVAMGAVAGPIFAVPSCIEYKEPGDLVQGLIAGPIFSLPAGLVAGSVLGFVNRRAEESQRALLVTGSIMGLLVGVIGTVAMMWHRFDLDQRHAPNRTLATYVYLTFVLFVMQGAIAVIIGLTFAWAVGHVMRSRHGALGRLMRAALVGAIGGLVAGAIDMAMCWCMLEHAISGYGGW